MNIICNFYLKYNKKYQREILPVNHKKNKGLTGLVIPCRM